MSRSAASRMGNVLSVVLCIMLLLSIAANAIAQEQSVLIWINDMGKRDSQFGYYDGLAAQSLDPVFVEYDFEGLACLHKTLYATSAMDGQRPSQLYTVAIDRDTNQATITLVGTIQNAQQEPFFEVAALAEKADGTLWGFAGVKDRRGLLKIDPVTAIAELVLPSKLGIEGIEWLGDTLWLVANGKFYTWTIDGALTFAFQVTDDIEGLDVVDGLLWGGLHDDPRGLVAIDPTTGVVVSEPGLTAGDDIESLTFCPLQPSASPTVTPTAIQTSTPTSTPTERPVIIVTEMATGLPTMTATPTSTLTPTLTPMLTLTPTPTATASPTPTLLVLPTKVTAEPPTPQPPTNEMPVDEPMTPNRYLTYLPLVNTTP